MNGIVSLASMVMMVVVALPCARKGIVTCVPPQPKAAPTVVFVPAVPAAVAPVVAAKHVAAVIAPVEPVKSTPCTMHMHAMQHARHAS